MSSPLRLVFLGSDPIALPLLEWLTGEGSALATVVAVYTQPDRPAGRGQRVVANEIKGWALARGLPVHQPDTLTEPVRADLATLAPDVCLVMAYGHILRDDFIRTPRLGTLNLHTSLLPKYRGASPIQTAIASGEHETGVTLMRIVRQLDAGPIADVERVGISLHDTALEVEHHLAAACVPLLARALPRLSAGTLTFTPQLETAATFCRRLEKADGALDFSRTAAELAARVNGLFPWPTCSIPLEGIEVKLGLAEAIDGTGKPGVILGADGQGLIIGTASGLLRVLRLQRPGGKMLAAGDFLRGFSVLKGGIVASRAMAPLVASTPFTRV